MQGAWLGLDPLTNENVILLPSKAGNELAFRYRSLREFDSESQFVASGVASGVQVRSIATCAGGLLTRHAMRNEGR